MVNGKEKLIVAIDTNEFDKAKELIDKLEDSVDIFKVGLEQYVATRGKTVDYLKEKGKKIFLDLKFHDIPNTMQSAVRAAVRDNVWLMTIHVSDMEGMRQCAVAAKEEAEKVLKNENATKEEVTIASTELKKAMEMLIKVDNSDKNSVKNNSDKKINSGEKSLQKVNANTEDNSPIMGWTILGIISIGAIVIALIYKKKKDQ